MGLFSQWSDPGSTAVVETGEWQGIVNAMGREMLLHTVFGTIKSSVTDSGNTPTTTLRAGMILGIKSADGLYYKYNPAATDGTQNAVAVLPVQLSMLNELGVVANKSGPLISRATLKVAELPNYDAQAGRQLAQRGFLFDAPAGAEGFHGWSKIQYADGATVVAADNGSLFIAAGAAAFTLPTPAAGLTFEFLQTADANMSIASAGSNDDIIVDGDGGADSVTFSTSSHKIGSRARFECLNNAAGALKWFYSNLGGTTHTIA
jgi:hypothetical protein